MRPAPIVTDAGAVNGAFPVDRTAVIPPVGALLVRVTVQVVTADGESTFGVQTRDEMAVTDTRAMVALAELPL